VCENILFHGKGIKSVSEIQTKDPSIPPLDIESRGGPS